MIPSRIIFAQSTGFSFSKFSVRRLYAISSTRFFSRKSRERSCSLIIYRRIINVKAFRNYPTNFLLIINTEKERQERKHSFHYRTNFELCEGHTVAVTEGKIYLPRSAGEWIYFQPLNSTCWLVLLCQGVILVRCDVWFPLMKEKTISFLLNAFKDCVISSIYISRLENLQGYLNNTP